jgi:hypothetical protein
VTDEIPFNTNITYIISMCDSKIFELEVSELICRESSIIPPNWINWQHIQSCLFEEVHEVSSFSQIFDAVVGSVVEEPVGHHLKDKNQFIAHGGSIVSGIQISKQYLPLF